MIRQPNPEDLRMIHNTPLKEGDWAVNCFKPGHFLKVHPNEFGKPAVSPDHSFFRPKEPTTMGTNEDHEATQAPSEHPTPRTEYQNRGGEIWEKDSTGAWRELFAEDAVRRLDHLERELAEAREQRDRLAEAVETVIAAYEIDRLDLLDAAIVELAAVKGGEA